MISKTFLDNTLTDKMILQIGSQYGILQLIDGRSFVHLYSFFHTTSQ